RNGRLRQPNRTSAILALLRRTRPRPFTIRRSPRRPREVGAKPTRSRHCKRGAFLHRCHWAASGLGRPQERVDPRVRKPGPSGASFRRAVHTAAAPARWTPEGASMRYFLYRGAAPRRTSGRGLCGAFFYSVLSTLLIVTGAAT